MRHTLLEKDAETMTGKCQVCGPVRLCKKSGSAGDGLRCGKKKAIDEMNRYYRASKDDDNDYMFLKVELLKAQDFKCAICNDDVGMVSHLDHDHTTGKVRGVLCRFCNLGLGQFKDNVESLKRAVNYLSYV